MKLVIVTQYRENYSDTDTPYWKNKFGDMFVVEDLTQKQIDRINAVGIPELTKLLEQSTSMQQTEVISHRIVPSAVHCEDICGDKPIELRYEDGKWKAFKESTIDWATGLKGKKESWTLLPECEREDYTYLYLCTDDVYRDEANTIRYQQSLKEAA